MLKFEQARLSNFLVYRDSTIDFDTDGRVTVIRAENGSGKTTFLRALEWAIYGDSALPGGTSYRLHPPDHEMPGGGALTISVEVDVEILDAGSGRRATIRRRSEVKPTKEGWERTPDTAEFVWADGQEGDEDELDSRLPWRLREFFFTDGDKATDYVGGIEQKEKVGSTTSDSSLSGNVSQAIRSLLGLDLLDAVRSSANRQSRDIDQQLARSSGSEALAEARSQKDQAHAHLAQLKEDAAAKKEELSELEAEVTELEGKRDDLLRHGDPDELEKRIVRAERQLRKAKGQLEVAQRAEAQTLMSSHLTYTAGQAVMRDYIDRADPLIKSGVVPASYLWWVRKRVELGECMCGYPLDPNGSDADKDRHQNVVGLIARSEEETKAANHAGDLYYHLHAQIEAIQHGSWRDELASARLDQDAAKTAIDESETEIAQLRPRLDALAGSPVAKLRSQIDRLRDRREELQRKLDGLAAEIKTAQDEAVVADRRLDAARRQAHVAGDLEIKAALYRDAILILSAAKDTRTTEDVKRLSQRMNDLFKEMIGGHQIIKQVMVQRENDSYEVVGIGIDGERMNVPHQFNGASKRALTNAFVLALGETAGVEAPNVIDTPLGMMDPAVRRNVFRVMAKECSQLVMLLTRAEIREIEELLDQYATVITVTNQASGEVMNRIFDDARSVVCTCNHRQYCEVCERDGDKIGPLERRVA